MSVSNVLHHIQVAHPRPTKKSEWLRHLLVCVGISCCFHFEWRWVFLSGSVCSRCPLKHHRVELWDGAILLRRRDLEGSASDHWVTATWGKPGTSTPHAFCGMRPERQVEAQESLLDDQLCGTMIKTQRKGDSNSLLHL